MQKTAKRKEETITIKNRWTGYTIFQSTKTTLKEAVEEAVENGADLRGANLRETNLCDADLSGTDLSGADLRHADLSGTNLFGTDLSEADLCGADLHYVKFYGRGGTTRIGKSQVEDLLKAQGISVNE